MANLTELEDWIEGIYRLETDDPVLGGEDGIDNLQAKQLGSRTRYLLAQLLLRAPINSPTFTGDPKAPTPVAADNDTSIATTAFVKTAIANLVASSPAALDTLNEIAAALGNDENFAATMTTALAAKAPIFSPTFTGDPKAPTAASGDNDTSIANTAFVKNAIEGNKNNIIYSNAVFDASVVDGEAVYWDAANSRFDEAIADGTVKQNAVGFADVTNSKVYAFGDASLFTGLTPGAKYYLSTTVAGGITSVLPATNIVQVALAKTATQAFVDIDATITLPIATNAEAQAFTANKIIDGAKLAAAFQGANQLFGGNGYQKFPGGLIIQWGLKAISGSASINADVTFPITFPTACRRVIASIGVGVADLDQVTYRSDTQNLNVGAPTASGCEMQAYGLNNTANVRHVQYIAIGD